MIETERLNADRTSEFRQRLRDACGRLLRRMLLTDREMRELAAHRPGTRVEDSARGVMAGLLESLGGRERHELNEIRAATARLDMGSFGVCETCGAAIPLPRLRAMPWARHCLGCQNQEERRP
jgi:DnaK suppressor protein